jgi:hypothetical protein
MIDGHWELGLLVGLILVHVLVTYAAYRLRGREPAAATDAAPSADGDLIDAENDVVECPDCGADNELGYRYCRSCVAELPTAMAFERDADGPLGRLSR